MTATTEHPCFIQPQNNDSKLWRYMDFTKFVSLASSGNLYFCRSDMFEDPFEGSYPKANVVLRPQVYKDMPKEHLGKMMAQQAWFAKWAREWTYINCWHANEYESAAMWNLYAKTNEAVAIETSYQKLKNVLPEKAYLGHVKYIDYESEWMPEGNAFYPFIHKRKSFEHENEVRAVIQDFPSNDNIIELSNKNSQYGTTVPINLNDLITIIHVAPTAPAWFADLVADVSAKYEISAVVRKSDLYSEPVF